MGLTMKERKAVTKELIERYRKTTKKQKGIILNEFTALTGYNRNYASYLLNNCGKTVRVTRNKVIKADVKMKVKRQRKRHYGESVKRVLTKIWAIYSYLCGKRLKPILQEAVARLNPTCTVIQKNHPVSITSFFGFPLSGNTDFFCQNGLSL